MRNKIIILIGIIVLAIVIYYIMTHSFGKLVLLTSDISDLKRPNIKIKSPMGILHIDENSDGVIKENKKYKVEVRRYVGGKGVVAEYTHTSIALIKKDITDEQYQILLNNAKTSQAKQKILDTYFPKTLYRVYSDGFIEKETPGNYVISEHEVWS